ncbi:uncharacterized protein YALI1_B01822g [Yarrowia lipolytica]|uniref:Uncharacterized protein n=1 Tax=Yarrowia lipolytica TaxID=4952 RepID=A0A1D8N5Z1_YARLL|nr:hypothetical protein YALI1_B01822g [Yarrowia lipolytica]
MWARLILKSGLVSLRFKGQNCMVFPPIGSHLCGLESPCLVVVAAVRFDCAIYHWSEINPGAINTVLEMCGKG